MMKVDECELERDRVLEVEKPLKPLDACDHCSTQEDLPLFLAEEFLQSDRRALFPVPPRKDECHLDT